MGTKLKILICFGAHNAWYGRLVRFILGCSYNHVFVAYSSKDWNQWMAVEVLDKTCVIPLDEALKRYSKVEAYECSWDLTPGFRSMVGYLGTDYDWKGVIGGLGRAILWRLFGWNIIKPFHNTSKLFCSEYVAELLQKNPVPEVAAWQTWKISPETLRSFCISNPCCARVDEDLIFQLGGGNI